MVELPPIDGIAIVPNQMLAGCKAAIWDGKAMQVSPAFLSLLKSAKTSREIEALLKSCNVINIGPPQHDLQWHLDDMQIAVAMFDSLLKK